MQLRTSSILVMTLSILFMASICHAQSGAKTKATKKVAAKPTKKSVAKGTTERKPVSSEAAMKRALANVGSTSVSRSGDMPNDPNRAVEIRGQSRTLSMMLVVKNGKENINFIKIRKDYSAEIAGTQY